MQKASVQQNYVKQDFSYRKRQITHLPKNNQTNIGVVKLSIDVSKTNRIIFVKLKLYQIVMANVWHCCFSRNAINLYVIYKSK